MASTTTDNLNTKGGWRRKRVAIPLFLLLALVTAFFVLRTPDTDRAAMVAKYGGAPSQFMAGPDGAKIHYRDQGNRAGPAMILLHGSNASLHTWEPLVARLGKTYRIISYDARGHGLTGAVKSRDYSPDAMVADVEWVRAQLGLDKIVLGGNSMGGSVAWRYAVQHPGHVRALLLLDAGGMPLRAGEKMAESNIGFRIMRYSAGRWLATQITPRNLIEKSLRGSVSNQAIVTESMIDQYWELLRFPGNREATGLRFSQRFIDPAAAEKARAITAPTLILFGKEDKLINPAAAQSFNERIAGSQVVLLDGIGHLPMEEAPDATAKAIGDFLTRRLAVSAP